MEEYSTNSQNFLFLELLQNADGGFATYELTRSYRWLEVTTLSAWAFSNFFEALVWTCVASWLWVPQQDMWTFINTNLIIWSGLAVLSSLTFLWYMLPVLLWIKFLKFGVSMLSLLLVNVSLFKDLGCVIGVSIVPLLEEGCSLRNS